MRPYTEHGWRKFRKPIPSTTWNGLISRAPKSESATVSRVFCEVVTGEYVAYSITDPDPSWLTGTHDLSSCSEILANTYTAFQAKQGVIPWPILSLTASWVCAVDCTKQLPDITARLSRHACVDRVQATAFGWYLALELELHVKLNRLYARLSVMTMVFVAALDAIWTLNWQSKNQNKTIGYYFTVDLFS